MLSIQLCYRKNLTNSYGCKTLSFTKFSILKQIDDHQIYQTLHHKHEIIYFTLSASLYKSFIAIIKPLHKINYMNSSAFDVKWQKRLSTILQITLSASEFRWKLPQMTSHLIKFRQRQCNFCLKGIIAIWIFVGIYIWVYSQPTDQPWRMAT